MGAKYIDTRDLFSGCTTWSFSADSANDSFVHVQR